MLHETKDSQLSFKDLYRSDVLTVDIYSNAHIYTELYEEDT